MHFCVFDRSESASSGEAGAGCTGRACEGRGDGLDWW